MSTFLPKNVQILTSWSKFNISGFWKSKIFSSIIQKSKPKFDHINKDAGCSSNSGWLLTPDRKCDTSPNSPRPILLCLFHSSDRWSIRFLRWPGRNDCGHRVGNGASHQSALIIVATLTAAGAYGDKRSSRLSKHTLLVLPVDTASLS